mmetsp:Transcript_9530/g.20096  ORF Transcript_9530/g.20096 Transcript_9530/m.20096 type:complete len:95 (-) Transcript_9530:57-341(-)
MFLLRFPTPLDQRRRSIAYRHCYVRVAAMENAHSISNWHGSNEVGLFSPDLVAEAAVDKLGECSRRRGLRQADFGRRHVQMCGCNVCPSKKMLY